MADIDVKERMDPQRFAALLRQTADAIERGESMDLRLQGQTFTVRPQGRMKAEYEVDEQEREIEFKIEWYEAA